MKLADENKWGKSKGDKSASEKNQEPVKEDSNNKELAIEEEPITVKAIIIEPAKGEYDIKIPNNEDINTPQNQKSHNV